MSDALLARAYDARLAIEALWRDYDVAFDRLLNEYGEALDALREAGVPLSDQIAYEAMRWLDDGKPELEFSA